MVLFALQILVTVSLIITILLQAQGSGLSTAFGGGGEFYRSKRSLEKLLFYLTIVLVIIFACISIILLLPHK